MQVVKVLNLIKLNGSCDYKGLDLSKIVAGSQLYPNDEDSAYFYYEGELIEHADISVVSQEVYDSCNQKIIDFRNTVVTPEKRIEVLEQENADLKAKIELILQKIGV